MGRSSIMVSTSTHSSARDRSKIVPSNPPRHSIVGGGPGSGSFDADNSSRASSKGSSKDDSRRRRSTRPSVVAVNGTKKYPLNELRVAPQKKVGTTAPGSNDGLNKRRGPPRWSVTPPRKKSKWEAGIEVINELLDPTCEAYNYITPMQRTNLRGAKELLLAKLVLASSGTSTKNINKNKLQHVPEELLGEVSGHDKKKHHHKEKEDDETVDSDSSSDSDSDSSSSSDDSDSDDRSVSTVHTTSTSFILQQFAGVNTERRRGRRPANATSQTTTASSSGAPVRSVTTATTTTKKSLTAKPALARIPRTNSGKKIEVNNNASGSSPPRIPRNSRRGSTMGNNAPSSTKTSPQLPQQLQPQQQQQQQQRNNTNSSRLNQLKRRSVAEVNKEKHIASLRRQGSVENGVAFPLPPSAALEHLDPTFVPPEFSRMPEQQKFMLFEMLQWNSINSWEFDIFKLDKISNGHPMLFVGWAVLGAPYAQQAMARELGINKPHHEVGYHFMVELNIPPEKLYNFVKVIEQDYNASNAYHNATHGADVLQSLHTLIQASAGQSWLTKSTKLQLFAVLLSALVHDVAHLGTTNAYQTKINSELAILYNDKSIMENWHIAHAFSRMLSGKDLPGSMTTMTNGKRNQKSNTDCNLLCNATSDQFAQIRKMMIDAILHTDMTCHFEMVNSMRGMHLLQHDKKKKGHHHGGKDGPSSSEHDYSWRVLVFMLHMADISAQTKILDLSRGWTTRCYDEFFAQGDLERGKGLPISANCDRNLVKIPDSQVGFLKFVVQPAFQVLGMYIPWVEESVLPIIEDNMTYYSSVYLVEEQ